MNCAHIVRSLSFFFFDKKIEDKLKGERNGEGRKGRGGNPALSLSRAPPPRGHSHFRYNAEQATMNVWCTAALALVLVVAEAFGLNDNNVGDRIKVELYYESQCPGCRQVRKICVWIHILVF